MAGEYAPYFTTPEKIVTPTIVLYEASKRIRQQAGKEKSRLVAVQMNRTIIADLDARTALAAAEVSLQWRLPLSDAVVYAAARIYNCPVITSDRHFEGLPEVIYILRPVPKRG